MKKVLISGATGLFGKELVKKLYAVNKYEIVAFSRHAKDFYCSDERLTAINGDATEEADLTVAMNGVNVVYCAVSGNDLPKVADNIVNVMAKLNIQRLIFMGAVGIYNEIPAELDDDDNVRNNPEQIPNLKAVEAIENSGLNYTIIRPGYLQQGNENDYVLTLKGEQAKGYISTISSVVNFAEKLIADDTLYSCQSVAITKAQVQ